MQRFQRKALEKKTMISLSIFLFYIFRLTNEIDKMITGQKELDAISAKEEGNNSISEKNESEEETDDIQQHLNSHKSPNIPNTKMKNEMQFPNQNNKYLYNNKKVAQHFTPNKDNLKREAFLSPSYTPQYTSQNILNRVNGVYATPTYHAQPLSRAMIENNFQRAMLSPLFMYNNPQNKINNNLVNNNPQNNFGNSPFCYTPNTNNYGYPNNTTQLLSPLTPSTNMFSLSPYMNVYQSMNSQYSFSPLISKPQGINQNANNNVNNSNGYHQHHNSSFFSFKPSQISTENEDNMLDNMLNKKIKNKKNKKTSTNDNIPNESNNQTNLNQFIGNKVLNHKPGITNVQKSPNLSNVINSPKDEEKNKIIIDNILYMKDKRTTLMIKNIPNKYTISTFLDEINVEFQNKYDIFYLPIDYGNKCNLGFAFINFVDPLHIINFYDMYRGKKWKRFNSEKICELVYAKIQGKKELISHFEKGKVLSFDSEEKRPLILPIPNPLPKVKLPMKLFENYMKAFPFSTYSIDNTTNNNPSEYFYIDSLYSY